MPKDVPLAKPEAPAPLQQEPHRFAEYILPPGSAPRDATFKQMETARANLEKDLHCSDKELPIQLACFELRCALAGISKREVIDTYASISKLVSAEKAVMPEMKRWMIGLDLVKHLSDPTKVDQGEFGTCAYSSLERMMYFHKPASAAKIVADTCTSGEFALSDGKSIKLTKDDLASEGFRSTRSAASYVLQTALQSAGLQTSFDVSRIYSGDQSQLHYRQTQDSGGFHESVVRVSGGAETVFDAQSSERILNMSRTRDALIPMFENLTGSKDQPVVIQGNPQRRAEPELRPSINCETEDQLHSVLSRLKSNGQLPIMVAVHTSQEPFWTDSGAGKAAGAGGERGGGHMVLITDYDRIKKLVAVDNSWGRKADHLGLADTAPRLALSEMLRSLNKRL